MDGNDLDAVVFAIAVNAVNLMNGLLTSRTLLDAARNGHVGVCHRFASNGHGIARIGCGVLAGLKAQLLRDKTVKRRQQGQKFLCVAFQLRQGRAARFQRR